MIAHVKQSGESLAPYGGTGEFWCPQEASEKLKDVHGLWSELGLRGLLFVSGAGNLMRGDALKAQGFEESEADQIGRGFTLMNTLFLAATLKRCGLPVDVFIAPTMSYRDDRGAMPHLDPYSVEAAMESYAKERFVLVAGGAGENGQSTDAAVLQYAAMQKAHTPDETVVAIKATKVDGVFSDDPIQNPAATRYTRISARFVREHYDRMGVVDPVSLDVVERTGVALRVYRDDQHPLHEVLADKDGTIGSFIIPDDIEPQLAA